MNRLEELPLDISTSCLLPYIQPEDFDTFCFSCARFETWSQNPKNIQYYLALHNIGNYWGCSLFMMIRMNSKILTEYFLSSEDIDLDIIMAITAGIGNIEIVKLLLNKGAKNYRLALDEAVNNNHGEVVTLLREAQNMKNTERIDV